LRYLYLSIASESSAITRVSTPATPEDISTILLLIPLLAVCGKLTLLLAVCGMPAAGAGKAPPPWLRKDEDRDHLRDFEDCGRDKLPAPPAAPATPATGLPEEGSCLVWWCVWTTASTACSTALYASCTWCSTSCSIFSIRMPICKGRLKSFRYPQSAQVSGSRLEPRMWENSSP